MQKTENISHNFLITGGEGFLGKRLKAAFSSDKVYTYDIVNGEDINDYHKLK